jgi:hypothetical protein
VPQLVRSHDAVNEHRTLSVKFLHAVNKAWDKHGDQVLDTLATQYPQVFGPMVARLVHVNRLEVGAPGDFNLQMTRAELLDKVGERFGQQGRAIFENFVKQLDRLQQERQTDDEAGALAWHARRRRPG